MLPPEASYTGITASIAELLARGVIFSLFRSGSIITTTLVTVQNPQTRKISASDQIHCVPDLGKVWTVVVVASWKIYYCSCKRWLPKPRTINSEYAGRPPRRTQVRRFYPGDGGQSRHLQTRADIQTQTGSRSDYELPDSTAVDVRRKDYCTSVDSDATSYFVLVACRKSSATIECRTKNATFKLPATEMNPRNQAMAKSGLDLHVAVILIPG